MPGINIPKKVFKDYVAYERFICSECKQLLTTPVQLSCGHRICQSCTKAVPRSRQSIPICPECGIEFNRYENFHDLDGEKEINNLAVICPYHETGCKWEGEIQLYFKHINVCRYDTSATYKPFVNNVDKDSMELVQAAKTGQSLTSERPFVKDNIEGRRCVRCHLLLKDPVQTACGHRFCKSCADEMIKNENLPRCPDCKELFDDEDGAYYFPDRFVKRELNNLVVICPFSEAGCDWEGKFREYEDHIRGCSFAVSSCEYRKESIHKNQLASHQRVCSAAPKPCPLAVFGCKTSNMTKEKLQQHMAEAHSEHMRQIVAQLKCLEEKVMLQEMHTSKTRGERTHFHTQYDIVESDAPNASNPPDSGIGRSLSSLPSQPLYSKPQYYGQLQTSVLDSTRLDMAMQRKLESMVTERVGSLTEELRKNLMAELKVKNDEVERLQGTVTKLEKTVKSKNAELEDRDFRLSLIENSNHDGSMIWKIPQFSQRKADAENGKYTSIFSLPFYTGRYGFKMCSRLYIMGDGIGKGTHISLFFVVMRGEFDNILQWPFTHKVTFKLINQAGGRDIVDTFQPDPMSRSFRKPKSDMNIASGCPRFVSHTELERGGFVVDDTIFIKCTVDTTIRHP